MKRRLLMAWLGLAGAALALPGDSVYQFDATLTNQRGQAVKLDAARGDPVLVSMVRPCCVASAALEMMLCIEAAATPPSRFSAMTTYIIQPSVARPKPR